MQQLYFSNSSTQTISIAPADNASFSYGQPSFCIVGATTTARCARRNIHSTCGIAINTTTGEIDLSSSVQGSYTITYTTPEVHVVIQTVRL